MAADKLISTKQAAEKMGVCKLTLLRRIKKEGCTLNVYKPMGQAYKFRESEVDAWIEENKVDFNVEPKHGLTSA